MMISHAFIAIIVGVLSPQLSLVHSFSCQQQTSNIARSLLPRPKQGQAKRQQQKVSRTWLSAATTAATESASESRTSSSVTKIDPFSSTSPSLSSSKFENFDYLSHWYPVVWARDLELDKPTKVTVFDVDYVVAKISSTANSSSDSRSSSSSSSSSSSTGRMKEKDVEVVAMVDYCPHKGAALSEGRITKSCTSRSFQCGYHGWLFDSKTGECIDIPQVEVRDNGDTNANSSKTKTSMRKKRDGMRDTKANGKAVPAMIDDNGMVWIFPGGGLEEALLRPPPPVNMIPEIGKDGFRPVIQVVRDFPIDWTILLENIMDPDHGLFAHQSKGFDLYSASKSNPVSIREQELDNGKGWTVTSQVDATYELLKRNEEQIMERNPRDQKKRKFDNNDSGNDNDAPRSTTTFVAPNMVFMGRRNKQGETSFVSCFFVTPTGTGRSRFMSCTIAKAPKWLKVPRFLSHVFINNFLDQDTYLLATQQRHVLATESQLAMENDNNNKINGTTTIPVRKKVYKYRSPTERLGARVGNFFDATVSQVPNRLSKIRNYGGYNNALEKLSTTRREVLDRKRQHTLICKDSMGLVKNCRKLHNAMKVIAFIPIIIRVLASGLGSGESTMSAVGMKLVSSIVLKTNRILKPNSILFIWTVSLAISYLARKLEKEFEFKYTEEFRDKDNDKIPSMWMDLL